MTTGSAPWSGARALTPWLLVVIAASLLVYVPGLTAGFVGDDFMILHRLRGLESAGDVWRFFRAEFFEYYRPLGFVAHAIDYGIAGPDPRQFHLTSLLLHSLNAMFVLLIGQRLSPGTLAGPVSALLFALHASNHEAVMWISAKFDLLATTFSLAALWWFTRSTGGTVGPAVLFGLALLSKEAAVAVPLAAAGWVVFQERAGIRQTVRRVGPWIGALLVYAVLRQLGGGVSAIGGSSRLPKLLAFGVLLLVIVGLAGGRWMRLRDTLQGARGRLAVGLVALLGAAAAAAAWSSGTIGQFAAEKLSVAGFVLFHLLSPVADAPGFPFYLDRSTPMYWGGGLLFGGVAGILLLVFWRPLLQDGRVWFLGTFLIATLLPISALTEGTRYLYLPSAAFSLLAGLVVAERRGRSRHVALAGLAVYLTVSAVEVSRKVGDWKWAGRMTAQGAALVDSAIAPACNEGHVVFLTSPVAVRGVYTQFYYETFELPRGCTPEVFQVLARLVRIDAAPQVRWNDSGGIDIIVEPYHGNVLLSSDLRRFDHPLRRHTSEALETPLGTLTAVPHGNAGVRLTLALSEGLRDRLPLFFYYGGGRMHRLEPRAP